MLCHLLHRRERTADQATILSSNQRKEQYTYNEKKNNQLPFEEWIYRNGHRVRDNDHRNVLAITSKQHFTELDYVGNSVGEL
jgi:chromatin remodeling complex protein RSC6